MPSNPFYSFCLQCMSQSIESPPPCVKSYVFKLKSNHQRPKKSKRHRLDLHACYLSIKF